MLHSAYMTVAQNDSSLTPPPYPAITHRVKEKKITHVDFFSVRRKRVTQRVKEKKIKSASLQAQA